MNECLNSGNKTEWCRANGILDKHFFYWQRILRKEAFVASTSNELLVITSPADETRPQKISFVEISLPMKQEPVRNGFHPDIVIRKGSFFCRDIQFSLSRTPVTDRRSLSCWMMLLGSAGSILLPVTQIWDAAWKALHPLSSGSVSKRYPVPVLRKTDWPYQRTGLGRRWLLALIQKTGIGSIQLDPHERRGTWDHTVAVPASHAETWSRCAPSNPWS